MTSTEIFPDEPSPIVILLTNATGQTIISTLALGCILLFNSFFFIFRPYEGLGVYSEDPLGEVYEIYQDGPADGSDIEVGDLILAIEGQPVNPRVSMPRYRPFIKPGETILFTIQRGQQILKIPITAGGYRQNLPLLGTYLGVQFLSLGFWIIGFLLALFTRPQDHRARLLSLGFVLAGTTMAVGGASGWNSFWGANTLQKALWCLLGAVLVTAHLTFPAISLPKYRPQLIAVVWIAALTLAALLMIDDWYLAPRGLSLKETYGVHLRRVVFVFFIVAWGFSVSLLARNRLLDRNAEIRRQTGIILWGMVIGIGPFFTLTLLPYLLFGEEYVIGSVTILFLGLVPLTYAYVIFQRKLLHIDLFINRILVSFVLLLLAFFLSILTFGVIVLAFKLPENLPLYGGLVAALIILPFPRLQRFVQAQVNRILYGSHYDFSSVTSSLSHLLAGTLDRRMLVEALSVHLTRQMGILEASLWLKEGDNLVKQAPGHSLPSRFESAHEILRTLEETEMPIRAEDFIHLLPDKTKQELNKLAPAQLFVPLIYEGKLNGMLVLGKRAASDMYSDQDMLILGTVAGHAALAWANVLLVERMRSLTHELVRSDEAHRKRLAGDLHDTILQDLFYVQQALFKNHRESGLAEQVGASIDRLRRLIKAQRPVLLNQGLAFAIEDLVCDARKMIGETLRIWAQISLPGSFVLSEEQSTVVYRIAQEAIANAVKHAQAKTIEVRLAKRTGGVLYLTVTDDGVGIPASNHFNSLIQGHYGLAIMRERAELIGATLSIATHPGGGTTVTLEIQP